MAARHALCNLNQHQGHCCGRNLGALLVSYHSFERQQLATTIFLTSPSSRGLGSPASEAPAPDSASHLPPQPAHLLDAVPPDICHAALDLVAPGPCLFHLHLPFPTLLSAACRARSIHLKPKHKSRPPWDLLSWVSENHRLGSEL